MNIVRWKPLNDSLDLFREMDRFFDNTMVGPHWVPFIFNGHSNPAVDVYDTEKELVVKAEMPGIEAEGLSIEINDEVLTIKGETKTEEEVKREDYYRQERRYGALTRNLPLPTGLEISKAEAGLENGVLTVTIPKSPTSKPKTVRVKAKARAKKITESKKAKKEKKS